MGSLRDFVDLFLHLDQTLGRVATDYGTWTYLILFVIVFCETGLVVTPFLPGDSLLFAAGAIAARGDMNVLLIAFALGAAALCGDNVNYFVGKMLGSRLVRKEGSKLLNRRHLERTHAFFEKYGGKTIIIARFVPIVRTFTPFVAGLGAMTYPRFLAYSVVGATLWVGVCVTAGYYFGRLQVVKDHFSLAILAVILVSLVPAVVEVVKHRRQSARQAPIVTPAPD